MPFVSPTPNQPPAPIAIFQDAPHPNVARLFVDYVLSERGQAQLAGDMLGAYSVRNDIDTAPGQKSLAEANALFATDLKDYEEAAAAFPGTFDRYFKV